MGLKINDFILKAELLYNLNLKLSFEFRLVRLLTGEVREFLQAGGGSVAE